jgi:hypothetical protein
MCLPFLNLFVWYDALLRRCVLPMLEMQVSHVYMKSDIQTEGYAVEETAPNTTH